MYKLICIFLCIFVGTVMAGSECPSREDLYPCSCLSFPLTKKVMRTVVNCHHVRDTNSLKSAFSALRNVQIDQLHIFNSFWTVHELGEAGKENQMVLPADWLTLLKVKEIEIFDTALSSCFACQSSIKCRNSLTVSFKAVNASTTDNVCGLCETNKGDVYSWTNCMTKLQHFEYTHGKLKILNADLFPMDMISLKTLNLSHNQLQDIKPNSLKKLKRLAVLDLSHNYLEDIDFIEAGMSLELLDVSWNHIKNLGDNLLSFLPHLKTISLAHNEITELKESVWKNPSGSLKNIDLTENPLHCDCSIRWVNSTFHINTVIEGTCSSPEDYETSLIRKASRMLIERCDEDGNIGTRSTKKKSNAPATTSIPRFRPQFRLKQGV